ncbi:MAG: TIGR00159 family protein [Acidobacteria bacterium]|nr:TIGR00159 family protein [Acidobacteriota bacterium]
MPHSLPPITITSVIDILLVATLIYQGIQIVRGRRAAHILTGILVLVLTYLGAVYARLDLLRSLLETLAPYTAFALIVMFQSEIRRGLAQLGRREWFSFGRNLQRREALEEMILAIEQLAETKTGALIILEREIGLRSFIESGVPLEANVSRDLLLTIFEKGSALHDGAAIVQGEKVAAAACFLPLTMNPVSRLLGTRHRAGIGVTEEADCLSVIVSEERGEVSLAEGGGIEANVSRERLQEALSEVLGLSTKKRHQQGRPNVRRAVEHKP